jgi:antagonist of KipI
MRYPESARLRVLRGGFLTTIQDLGRLGFRRFGMPVGGAMDRFALRLANRLVGNVDSAAALEITLQGPELMFETDAVIAVAGADLSAMLDSSALTLWAAVKAPRGSMLRFGVRRSGARAYLAVAGGIDVPVVLGSRATYLPSRTGGLAGRPLTEGDVIHGGRPPDFGTLVGRRILPDAQPTYGTGILRAVAGPQANAFTRHTLEAFTEGQYIVSPRSDRIGYRLTGPSLVHAESAEFLSDATPPGAVQVPPDWQPILLMADCPTTGGYPKIAVVITADLPLAAQLLPADAIRFSLVDLFDAQQAARKAQEQLDTALSGPQGPTI